MLIKHMGKRLHESRSDGINDLVWDTRNSLFVYYLHIEVFRRWGKKKVNRRMQRRRL